MKGKTRKYSNQTNIPFLISLRENSEHQNTSPVNETIPATALDFHGTTEFLCPMVCTLPQALQESP
jgi:hypothetical protein